MNVWTLEILWICLSVPNILLNMITWILISVVIYTYFEFMLLNEIIYEWVIEVWWNDEYGCLNLVNDCELYVDNWIDDVLCMYEVFLSLIWVIFKYGKVWCALEWLKWSFD